MNPPEMLLKKPLLENALQWFQPHFRQSLVSPIEMQFPNFPLTRDIQEILRRIGAISRFFRNWEGDQIPLTGLLKSMSDNEADLLPLFKRIVLLYRRDRAASTERYTEKTFHLELAGAVEEEVKALDA